MGVLVRTVVLGKGPLGCGLHSTVVVCSINDQTESIDEQLRYKKPKKFQAAGYYGCMVAPGPTAILLDPSA